jgi:hypothetical protein
MEEILMGGTGMFLLKEGSRNSINNKRREENFSANYRQYFGLCLPHQDTIFDVLCQVEPDQVDRLKMDLMSDFFDQKCLRDYRLLNTYYLVAVDATGMVGFKDRHCEHCLTKKSSKGKTTYFHYVLEAKLVTRDGHCFSLATEWIENPEGDFDKQDCERKAFTRLAAKVKKQYPRLSICILADGLYPYEGVFDVCQNNEWKYIIVLQDKSLKSVQEELVLPRRQKPVTENYVVRDRQRISSQYRLQTGIMYHKKYVLNWFQCIESKKKDVKPGEKSTEEPTVSCFEYVTNIEPAGKNIIELSAAGRLRWKIENEGFNTQKCGGYELEHKYCRKSYAGLKNYYTLLQIAHAINQFVEKTPLVTNQLKEHSKETICNIWSNLLAYMLFVNPQADAIKSVSAIDAMIKLNSS